MRRFRTFPFPPRNGEVRPFPDIGLASIAACSSSSRIGGSRRPFSFMCGKLGRYLMATVRRPDDDCNTFPAVARLRVKAFSSSGSGGARPGRGHPSSAHPHSRHEFQFLQESDSALLQLVSNDIKLLATINPG